MIHFDILFDDLGEFGLAQFIIILLFCYFNAVEGINAFITVFIAYQTNSRYVTFLKSKTIYLNANIRALIGIGLAGRSG